MPRFGVAARTVAAPPGARRALRLGLPHPARGRCEAAGRARRAEPRTSRTCMPGAKCICRARDGSASIPPPACSPARGISRSPARRSRPRAAPVAVGSRMRERVRARDERARIWEAPRVTKPYSDAQWTEIQPLGTAIDAQLRPVDVRLTMGGEPTFVSSEDPDEPEWNTAALGKTSAPRGGALLEAEGAICPDGLAHFGQGKWYPGEQLPRWSLNCFWRKDAEPIWTRSRADRREERAIRSAMPMPRDCSPRSPRRSAWARSTCSRPMRTCSITRGASAARRQCRSRSIPRSRIRSSVRASMRVFESGLDAPVGYVLPVTRAARGGTRGSSGRWFLRRERCYLVPGDSPIGYPLAARLAALG